MARKQMSARPRTIAAKLSRAASQQARSTGTPSRAPSSRAISTVTPAGAATVPWARTGLPRLIAARSTPPGTRSPTTASSTLPTNGHRTKPPGTGSGLDLVDLADVVNDQVRHARVEFHHALGDSADVAQHPVVAGPCARQETRARDRLMQCLRREGRMEIVVAVENKRWRCHRAEL